jgi:hypothetical protein
VNVSFELPTYCNEIGIDNEIAIGNENFVLLPMLTLLGMAKDESDLDVVEG